MRWPALALALSWLCLMLPTPAQAQSAPAALRLHAGLLRPVLDQWHFEPCDSTPVGPRRARDVSPESSITSILTDIGLDRRDTTYIEAFGRVVDGEVRFERLNRAGAEMTCASATNADRHWQAQGNEPFWALRSDARGLSLRQPGSQLNLPPLALRWNTNDGRGGEAAVLVGRTEMTALDLTLTARLCRDSMADIAYGFRAEVVLTRPQAARFEGCAYLGSELPPWARP